MISICIATFNKSFHLTRVLNSIAKQNIKHKYEILIADDGSEHSHHKQNRKLCKRTPYCYYQYLQRPELLSPGYPRNIIWKKAQGDILFLQSDDVEHLSEDLVNKLVEDVDSTNIIKPLMYRGKLRGKELSFKKNKVTDETYKLITFHIGAITRENIFKVGGNDLDFKYMEYEDLWLSDCLLKGLKLKIQIREDLESVHLYHPKYNYISRPEYKRRKNLMRELYEKKVRKGKYISSGGPWKYAPQKEK